MARGTGSIIEASVFALLLLGADGLVAADPHPTPEDPRGGLILGCPAPLNELERPQTSTDAAAVFMLVEALTLCDGETITHGEDRDLQARLRLQEKLEKIDRKRAREARLAQGRAKVVAVAWHADPTQAPPR